jgi:hypothetical protein
MAAGNGANILSLGSRATGAPDWATAGAATFSTGCDESPQPRSNPDRLTATATHAYLFILLTTFPLNLVTQIHERLNRSLSEHSNQAVMVMQQSIWLPLMVNFCSMSQTIILAKFKFLRAHHKTTTKVMGLRDKHNTG